MRIRPTVALAFGIGYVLGTRAGRESYDEISRQARALWDRPELQSVAGIISAQASGVYDRARGTLGRGTGHGGSGPAMAGGRFSPPGGTPSSNGVGTLRTS
jgi:hypothetical protein